MKISDVNERKGIIGIKILGYMFLTDAKPPSENKALESH